ncbi:MAG TPA: TAXI family TRAP transporter solute-binding subunit [Methylophilaceae bacterium]|nr:TAXI family TRAP transporter solute-binding subunit [Methylophilaceae bacterium]
MNNEPLKQEQEQKQGYKAFTGLFTREMLEATLPSILLLLAALYLAYKFIDPAPPRKIVISTGSQDQNYNAYASIYREYLKQEGITLEMRPSNGDLDNLKRLQDDDSDVDVAFIKDGVASSQGAGSLLSLGSLYYEPIWIFANTKDKKSPNAHVRHMADLKGKRIAIGKPGDGAHQLALRMLSISGVDEHNSKLVEIGGEQAVDAMLNHQVDVAILVDVPTSPLLQRILSGRDVELVDLDDAEAFSRQMPYLHHLILPEGGLDLERNIPSKPVSLLAPTTALVVRADMHPALVYLMLKVITQVHGGPGLLNAKGEFPAAKDADFPLSSQAAGFYKNGLPFIDKYLPFWAATFVNRSLVVILPLLAILIPLTKIVPVFYNWLVRRKLFRCYGELRYLDSRLQETLSEDERKEMLAKLDEIENHARVLRLPVTFSQYAYELRAHIELVRSRLKNKAG